MGQHSTRAALDGHSKTDYRDQTRLGQKRIREELLESLRITLDEAIEMNRQETHQAAGEGYEEVRIKV